MELHERLFSEEQFGSGFGRFIYRGIRKSWRRGRTLSEDAVNEAAQDCGLSGVIDGGTRHRVVEEKRSERRLQFHRALPDLPASPAPLPLVELRDEALCLRERQRLTLRNDLFLSGHEPYYR